MSATKGEGVRFQNFVVEKINYKYKELQAEYEKAQVELSKAVVKICSGYVQALHALTNTVGVIDVLTAFSVIAISSEYSRPKILEKGTYCIL